MKIISRELLDQLTEAARLSPRLRMNHNLHSADNSRCHRLLNAIEPSSYIHFAGHRWLTGLFSPWSLVVCFAALL